MGGFPFLAEDDMKCKVLHESAGRLRVHIVQPRMTLRQADLLEYYMKKVDGVVDVKVYDRTGDAVISGPCSGTYRTRAQPQIRG